MKIFLYVLLIARVHSTIVHLFEWKFNDIGDECVNFLGPYGYTGVQISPVNEYAVLQNRPWFERYQPYSFKILSRSGNEEELKRMVRNCANAGIKVYVDVVINHMSATNPDGTKGSGGSDADSKSKYYPAVPFSSENFHSTCALNNFDNATEVRVCELVGLHDLDQSQQYVRDKIIEFLNRLIDIGVAGFRVDAAKHIWPQDLSVIYGSLHNLSTDFGHKQGSRAFIYQEVSFGGAVSLEEYTTLGHVTEFRYGLELSNAFKGNNLLKWLTSFGEKWNFESSDKALVFVDNHDTQRGNDVLTHNTPKLYKMAVGFMLSWPYGTKRVMSSFEFDNKDDGPPHNQDMSIKNVTKNPDLTCNDGWICEHRWRQIYSMVKFDQITQGTPVTNFMDNGANQISFCRGNKGFVAFNGDNYNMSIQRNVCLPSGVYCDVISGLKVGNKCTGKTVTVGNDGSALIEINTQDYDGILAIHQDARISLRGSA